MYLHTALKSLFLLVLSLSIVSVKSQENPHYNGSIVSRLIEIFYNNRDIINATLHLGDAVRMTLPVMVNLDPDNSRHSQRDKTDDKLCDWQFSEFLRGVEQFEPWALKMVDASSKIPSGILIGNIKDMGIYDECVTVEAEKMNNTIRGRHCMYSLSIKDESMNIAFTQTLAICLPSACGEEHLTTLLQEDINIFAKSHGADIDLESVVCTSVEPEAWSVGKIITVIFLSLFSGFLMVCTILDIFLRTTNVKYEKSTVGSLSQFSLYKNAERILDTKLPNDNFPALEGIRFFNMTCVIFGHEYFLQTINVTINSVDLLPWQKTWAAFHIRASVFVVDTFFVMTGFLTAYIFIKKLRHSKFNLFMYYLHHYLRLTPSLVALLLLTIFIFPSIGDGPIWESNMQTQVNICSRNWWAMLLYVHNYVNTEYIACLIHTWYMAVEMQLFWISPFILYPLSKRPKIGLFILGILLIGSIAIPAIITAKNTLPIGDLQSIREATTLPIMRRFYTLTHTRAGPWLMGVFLGYKLAVDRKIPNRKFIVFGWSLTFLAFTFIVFAFTVFLDGEYTYNVYWEAFYAALSRHIWSFAICWFIYASAIGCGGFISRFLSHPVFIPFGKISYSAYIIHYSVIFMNTSATRVPSYFSQFSMLNRFFSDYVMSLLSAFVFSLFFESPFLVVEKMLYAKLKQA